MLTSPEDSSQQVIFQIKKKINIVQFIKYNSECMQMIYSFLVWMGAWLLDLIQFLQPQYKVIVLLSYIHHDTNHK